MIDLPNESGDEFSIAEYRQVKALAVASGLSIEGFKRQCVRRILFASPQPTPPVKVPTTLRAMLQSVASFKLRKSS